MIFDFRTSCMQENDNEMLLSTRRSLKVNLLSWTLSHVIL